MHPTPPTKSYVERLRVEEGHGPAPGRENGAGEDVFIAPLVETASSFRPGKYLSPLMPQENKPLEMSILKRVKELLAEVDVRTAAKHITMADCTVGTPHAYRTHRGTPHTYRTHRGTPHTYRTHRRTRAHRHIHIQDT
jgi:hypothetical protein